MTTFSSANSKSSLQGHASPLPGEKRSVASFPDCATCPISKFGIYSSTLKSSPDNVSGLRARVSVYEPNRPILRQGQTSELFGSIRSGWAYVYKTLTDGRRHIQGFLIPGDTVALDLLLIGSAPISVGVRALTGATVCWFPVESMRRLVQEGKAQQEETQLWMSYYLWTINHRAATIGHSSAPSRVAELIVELVSRIRYRGFATDEVFEFPPTQAHIADCLGLTPVHVNRVLGHLHRQGILEIRDKSLRIFDEKELNRIADEKR